MAFFKIESYKTGIVLSTFFNFFNKGLVFLNGIVVAYYLGVRNETDIFFYVYNTVLLVGVFVASLNSTVLIPQSMHLRTAVGEKYAMYFLNRFIALYGGVMLLIVLIISVFPVDFFVLISSFSRTQLEASSSLLLLSLPLVLLIGVITLLIDILSSYRFFTISMMIGIINGLSSIIFVVAFHKVLDMKSVFFGLIVSYTFNLVLLLGLMRYYLRWEFRFVKVRIEKKIWRNLLFANLGNITSVLSSYMPLYILAGLATGIITSLTFAQQIAGLPNALIIAQFGMVAGIKFNELVARKDFLHLNKVYSETTGFLLFLTVPLGFFIYLYSFEIATFLVGKKVIGVGGIGQVSFILQYLGLLLPLQVINTMSGRLFMATHKVKEGFWYQVAFNILLLTVMYVSVENFGLIGYPISLLGAHVLNVLCLYFIKRRWFPYIQYVALLRRFFSLLMLNAALSLLIYFCVRKIGIDVVLLRLICAFSFHLVILLVLNKVFKISDEVNVQLKTILKKIS